MSRCTFQTLIRLALGGLVLSAPDALAADVRGQLVLGSVRDPAPPNAAKPPRAAYNWELENGVKEVTPTRVVAQRELAVVLLGSAPNTPANTTIDVTFSGGALLPSTLALRAGWTLRIRNDDEIGHELLAEGLDIFSAEATSPGGVRAVNLPKVGNWALKDRLATHARAHLHVLENLVATAKLDASGSYAFSDIAPGKYTLKVLRGGSELVSKDIEVADKPLTVDPLTLGNDKGGS